MYFIFFLILAEVEKFGEKLSNVFICILTNYNTKYRFTFNKDVHIKIVL